MSRGIDSIQWEHSDGEGDFPPIECFATGTHVPFYDVHPVRNRPEWRYDYAWQWPDQTKWYITNLNDAVGVQNYPEAI